MPIAETPADPTPAEVPINGTASKLAVIAGLPTSAAIVVFFGWMLSAMLEQMAESNRDAGERWKIVARLEAVIAESTNTNREMKSAIAEMNGAVRQLTDEIRRTPRSPDR